MTRRGLLMGAAATSLLPVFGGSKANAGEAKSMRYTAMALQTVCEAVNQDKTPEASHARMNAAITRVTGQIMASKGFLKGFNGYDLKLVVLPEYWMTGFPMGETRETWQAKAAIPMDGAFPDALAKMAQTTGVYLCSNHYETDPNFPELYFQSNVIYGPTGNTLLRYRRMISLYSPSPYDVWDKYLDIYGADAVFPVVETEIGALATIASEEILYPEIARMHAFKGAEILLHPTSEVGSPSLTPKHIAKKARAIENIAYVVSANSASITGTPVPAASTDGMSIVLDWYGRTLGEAGTGETMNANAVLDLTALRETRRKTGMTNTLSRLPLAAFAPAYASTELAPPNRTPDGKMVQRADALSQQQAVIDRLAASGVLK
ncbi:nitrilase [Hyphomonas sp. WL0036]|uniref:nitrilase-related carbon-nitrogen hydrolase n=1 Tax=Hyphomonas sediminis TaxID=2866160 RepID=UPI001C80E13D|nr:nitrilase-related carbon-nitrogen hydrolase [Hyphomonas sediminis]MBY9066954.1 nitrilase [Hyphomonas sediminis]